MQIKEQLEHIVAQALDKCVTSGQLPLEEVPAPALERPRDMANGDWASTVAMRCATIIWVLPGKRSASACRRAASVL